MFNFIKKVLFGSSSTEPEVKQEVTPQRAKDAKGQFVADDPSTPNVNEAWKDGKAPAKKVRAASSNTSARAGKANIKRANKNNKVKSVTGSGTPAKTEPKAKSSTPAKVKATTPAPKAKPAAKK